MFRRTTLNMKLNQRGGAQLSKMNTTRNPVAKNSRKYNKARVYVDRKKAAKQGKVKHKISYK